MTLIALTDCCRLLAIDGKTLRRWLAQAQLPVQAHPSDARCKGLTGDQLLLLARAHRRSLAALPQEWPAPTAPAETSPELSAELITALQTLSALPAQIAALQQQLAKLTALVQLHPPRPSVTIPHAQRRAARVGSPTPTKASARSRPAASSRAKQPGPSVQVLPLIEYGIQGTYVVLCPTHGLLALDPFEAPGGRGDQTLPPGRRVEIGVHEVEADRVLHVSLPTRVCPGFLTVYFTVPGGVPSVMPVTVSRHTALPSMRMNAE